MLINWSQFTPWSALAGGAVIGMAVAILVLFNGRIAGISGILGGLFKAQKDDIDWRIAFVSGLIAAPLVWQLFLSLPAIRIDGSYAMMAMAGLVVGLGTRYGSGCTSGHGVCGLSRLSPRSIVATLVFMGTGFVTVYVIRHIFQI
ncbi:YeeE/YedE family protein [Nitrosospira sp. NpAV]|uniref:YeeE/YedE family protein n=1 Tax=Nitrosospira sp. NpAV TaxID=58133 RepID=UPI00059F54D4|nr:YeeE/YedE family protein [Nitrosospira sp. NpAV]KIO49195.1 YeeE/YedE [Nitrosospira sp. NpAV]